MERVATTVTEAIAALGGTKAVAERLGRKQQAVSNWRHTGFPANTYVALSEALKRIGVTASPELWGMAPDAPSPGEPVPPESPSPQPEEAA